MLIPSHTQTPEIRRSLALTFPTVIGLVLATVLIALLSTASRVQTSADAGFSLFWPSAGIGLALVARFGILGLAPVLVGVGLWAGWVMQWGPGAIVWTAVASASGPALTWYLLRARFARVSYPFSLSETLLWFMRVQALGGSTLAAIIGSAGLWFTGHWTEGVSFWVGVLAYWMLETTGAFLFAPVAWSVLNPSGLSASSSWHRRFAASVRDEWYYAVLVLILTSGVCALLFTNQSDFARALLYGLLPLLVVISIRASPTLVQVLILASGVLVLVAMANLVKTPNASGDGTQLLLASLYLLVGTATLQVLLATSSEKRAALERLERQAFVDASTRLLNEAGMVRELESRLALGFEAASNMQVSLIGLTLTNLRQVERLADGSALQKLDRQMADQLRRGVPEVRWARTGVGRFQGVWSGEAKMLDPVLSKVRVLTIPMSAYSPADALPDGSAVGVFRPEWAVAAVKRDLAGALQDFSVPSMISVLALANTRAQQFRRVEVLALDDGFMKQQQQEAAMTELVRQAINDRAFLLYAQPILPNHADAWIAWHQSPPILKKFEVLVRMTNAQGLVIPPALFMPAAMAAGLMPQLDLAVVEQTFSWLAEHPHALELIQGCAVNLSGPTVGDARTVEYIKDLFTRFPVPPGIMIFEITESMAVTDPEVAEQTLKALRDMGSRVAIDDFGTGVATFDYLKRFQVDFIKIDGTFVRALQQGELDRVIVESMVNVAKCLGVRTVAEFVSSAELYELVTALSIDESQGYALSEPQPLEHWFPKGL